MKRTTNKSRTRFRMICLPVFILMCICWMAVAGCGSVGGTEEEETPTAGGRVATSAHYSLDRASLGTSFEQLESSDRNYQANATIGYPFVDESSVSDSYLVSFTLNTQPLP